MRATTRFVAFALWACCLAALPSHADDSPQAHFEGVRCEVLRTGEAPPAVPASTAVVCQIVDDPNPYGTVVIDIGNLDTPSPTLDSLLQLLTTLDNARHDASLQRHDAVVPAPTP